MGSIDLFIYTLEEYKKMISALPLTKDTDNEISLTDNNYVGIQVRLMLMRKYFRSKENVFVKTVIHEAIKLFPEDEAELKTLSREYDSIEHQQLEHILSDGTKLNLYQTIQDTIYGVYLHADGKRIEELEKTESSLRFYCCCRFVIPFEELLMKIGNYLEKNGIRLHQDGNDHAVIVHLGDPRLTSQNIHNTEYWRNAYGYDLDDQEVKDLIEKMTLEDIMIFKLCIEFMQELSNEKLNIRVLKTFVHPWSKWKRKTFYTLKAKLDIIPNPGMSNYIERNMNEELAYVKILPHVTQGMTFDSEQLITQAQYFTLAKYKDNWKIYAFGDKMDSIIKKELKIF